MYRTAANRLLRFRVLRSGITSHGFPLPPTLKRSLIKPSIHLILPRRHLRRTGTIRVTEEGIQKPITRRSKLECCKPHYDMSYIKFGWSEEAMVAGAKEIAVSPIIVGSFPSKEASLVEPTHLKAREDRLEMQVPYIPKWPQALSIQALQLNVPTSFKQRTMLVDEIWHASGDEDSDIDWHVKRTVLGEIYSTEIYMLTDRFLGLFP